jgi:membrane-bound lytic murein transglycosylase D
MDSLKQYNPALKSNYIPRNKTVFELRLPDELCYCFIEENDRIQDLSKSYQSALREEVHTVQRGESLILISNRYGCSVSELKQWNNLRSSTIHPGQKLVLLL